jgi:hypothetical protein
MPAVAHIGIGQAYYCDGSDGRVLLQSCLDLGGIDVGAAGEDHVLQPVAEVEVAVLI